MGTTRIKVIDLSSSQKEIKTARKHARFASPAKGEFQKEQQAQRAEKLAGVSTLKKGKKVETAITDSAESVTTTENTESSQPSAISPTPSAPPELLVPSPKPTAPSTLIKKQPRHRGTRYQKAASLIEKKDYTLEEALTILPQTSFTKFDPTVEAHLVVSGKNLKVMVNMPHLAVDKKEDTKYLIFCDPPAGDAGKQSTIGDKQIIWGDEKTIADIESGTLKPGRDFNMVISSPKFMPRLARVAKILGPKGMMPNPKNQTVTEDVKKYFEKIVSPVGISVKTDPTAPLIHTKFGKLSQKPAELTANFEALISAIGAAKIKKATIKTTMSPAIRINTSSL